MAWRSTGVARASHAPCVSATAIDAAVPYMSACGSVFSARASAGSLSGMGRCLPLSQLEAVCLLTGRPRHSRLKARSSSGPLGFIPLAFAAARRRLRKSSFTVIRER